MSKRANGDGSIWQRSDGRWCAAYYVPKSSGGRVRKYVYGQSREEVRRKLTELIRNVDQDVPVPIGGQTVSDYLAEWLQHVRPLLRESTYAAYESNVRLHISPRIGKRRLDKLSARDVRLMLDDLRTNGRRPRLVQYVHATLRAALEHAVREELVARNVARLVKVPRPQPAEREALSVEDAKTLLKAAEGERLHALYVVVLLLGLRRSEVTGLRWRDVDLDSGTLTVRQTLHRTSEGLKFLPPKTQRSRRTVPLPPAAADALNRHRDAQRAERVAHGGWPDAGLVFTTPRGTPVEPRNCPGCSASWPTGPVSAGYVCTSCGTRA
jgi:integrase